METTRRPDPYAAARRAGHIERSRVDRVGLAAESALYDAVERSNAAQRAAARTHWRTQEAVYQDVLRRRDEATPRPPLAQVEEAVKQDALAYVEIIKKIETENPLPRGHFSKDAIEEIAKRELKKTRNGVVRQGHAFIVMPEAIKTFIGTFRSAEKSIRAELATPAVETQEVGAATPKLQQTATQPSVQPKRYEIARSNFSFGM
jgi:hypothetical protein